MAISPTNPAQRAAAAAAAAGSAQAAPMALKPGDVLTALVLQTLADGTARLAVGDALLDVASQIPLTPGSTVRLAVQSTNAGLTLALLDSDRAPQGAGQTPQGTLAPARAAVAGAVDKAASPPPVAAAQPGADTAAKPAVAALAHAVRGAAARQDGLAPLFADAAEVAEAAALPKPVRQAIAQLLAFRTPAAAPITGDTIRQAMSRSGLFLEARLAAASPGKNPTLANAPTLAGAQLPPADLKAALLALRQVLRTWVGDMPATQTGAQPAQPTAQPGPLTETRQDARPAGRPVDGAPQAAEPSADTGAAEEGSGAPGVREVVVTRTVAVADRALPSRPPAGPSGTGEVARTSTAPLGSTQSADKMPATGAGGPAGGSVAPAVLLAMLERSVRPGPPGVVPEDGPDSRLPNSGQQESGGEGSRVRGNAPPASGLPASRLVDLLERGLALPEVASGETHAEAPPNAVTEDAAPRAKDAPEPTAPPAPPYRGGPSAAQPAAAAGITDGAEPHVIGERLLTETDAALARHTLLQAASLPDGAGLDQPDRTQPRWAFEIPLATPQGTAVAQFEIARDGGKSAPSAEAKPAWRARFTLDIEPIGPVHVQIALSGARAGVTLWAERQESAARLRAEAPLLADALREVELEPGDVLVRDGQPPRSAAAAGRFLDRAS
jgi:hypothetical protein